MIKARPLALILPMIELSQRALRPRFALIPNAKRAKQIVPPIFSSMRFALIPNAKRAKQTSAKRMDTGALP